MKRSLIAITQPLVLLAVLSLGAVACDDASEGGVITTPPATDTFELVYVSGHLGSYWDCPGDALSDPAVVQQEAGAAAGEAAGSWADGDCIGDGCGPWVMNCEHAEVTVRLKNTGETPLSQTQVTRIALMPDNGEGSLDSELLDVTRSDGQPLTADIVPGEEVELIVQFKGLPPSFDMSWFESAGARADMAAPTMLKVELEVSTDAQSETVQTPGLQTLPVIAT